MDRKEAVRILNSWGVQVDASLTDQELRALVEQGKPEDSLLQGCDLLRNACKRVLDAPADSTRNGLIDAAEMYCRELLIAIKAQSCSTPPNES